MKYNNPYVCDYLKFYLGKRKDPLTQKSKDYAFSLHSHPTQTLTFIEETVLSREELKGLADFIYNYLENN
jgi:hypothetical protein